MPTPTSRRPPPGCSRSARRATTPWRPTTPSPNGSTDSATNWDSTCSTGPTSTPPSAAPTAAWAARPPTTRRWPTNTSNGSRPCTTARATTPAWRPTSWAAKRATATACTRPTSGSSRSNTTGRCSASMPTESGTAISEPSDGRTSRGGVRTGAFHRRPSAFHLSLFTSGNDSRTARHRQNRLQGGGRAGGDVRQTREPLLPLPRHGPARRARHPQTDDPPAGRRRGGRHPAADRRQRLRGAARRARRGDAFGGIRLLDAETHEQRRQAHGAGHRRPLRLLRRGLRPGRCAALALAHDFLAPDRAGALRRAALPRLHHPQQRTLPPRIRCPACFPCSVCSSQHPSPHGRPGEASLQAQTSPRGGVSLQN